MFSNLSKKKEKIRCFSCNSLLDFDSLIIDEDQGLLICPNCGAVISEYEAISPDKEYRLFSPQDQFKKARVTKPSIAPGVYTFSRLIYDEGMGRLSFGTESTHEKMLRYAKSKLEEVAPILNLNPGIIQGVLSYLARLFSKRTIKRRDLDSFIAAAIYLVSRELGCAKPLDRLIQVFERPKKSISRALDQLKRTLNLWVRPPRAEDFLPSLGMELRVSPKVLKLARRILEEARKLRLLDGKDPCAFAAASIYYACDLLSEARSQKQIAAVSASTEVTIRNCYRILKSALDKKIKQILSELEE